MPEDRSITLFRWGEELRRRRRDRRLGRLRIWAAAGSAAAVTALAATLFWPPGPLLLWNSTASAPLGLYRVGTPSGLEPGDMVVAWAPLEARRVASERGYAPFNVPLVKIVAAGAGDEVCAAGEAIFINGRLEARRRASDPLGRPLPWWNGCTRLSAGELFLLTPGEPDSFDGRYFGVSYEAEIVGRARLIWGR